MFAEALWRRQRCFIAGDRMFKDYEQLLDVVLKILITFRGGFYESRYDWTMDEWEKECSRRLIKAGHEVHGYLYKLWQKELLKNNMKRVISVDVPLLWKALFK